ncbi:hypothetical protein GLAREA_06994 [Glarea lozoyensis ATCC 20868]|uniref:Ankyrin repeat-containing protein n=1 Tax=Glarea lozoyensis (strain ATCC 20868 / MF5171) TaxID=1116229 RepID=S3DPF4_GLAL2|nr:uncharacterized protein GLAREA_06994 [Glarea lozoyensis ATCC 20868]EPE33981.1 hypothetical protein GLAREA_06994 [Glarea lozoyensis ATCC 20868]
MKQNLDYCYKTYANRYKDWHLPVDRCEREQTVRELFALVSDSTNYQSSSSSSVNSSRLPIRPLQPHPSPQVSQSPQPAQQPYSVPQDFLFPPQQPPPNYPPPSHPPPQHPIHPPQQLPPQHLPPQLLPPQRPPPQQPLPRPPPPRRGTSHHSVPKPSPLFQSTIKQEDFMELDHMSHYQPMLKQELFSEPEQMTNYQPSIEEENFVEVDQMSNYQPSIKQESFREMDQMSNYQPSMKQDNFRDSDQMSIASTATWSTGSAPSAYSYYDETFSSPRYSVSTMNSSVSSGSRIPHGFSLAGQRPLRQARHDPRAGTWNELLRVVPCGKDHSRLHWNVPFPTCTLCGFSQWHALMIQARSIDISTFVTAMIGLRDICSPDFAGNQSLHFLMAAGVGMDYFRQPLLDMGSSQNVFGQNPLHVLDPQDLGEELIGFLGWFKAKEHPEGLLLTQRDIKGRTPMHYLLQQPLERHMYAKMLEVFPYEHHQLRTFDTSGRTAVMLMSKAASKIKAISPADYARIQAGISETKLYQSQGDGTPSNQSLYGFHDIARGARGTSYMGAYFECRICNRTDAHSNSYLAQMICACTAGRDRNGPDDTGMTAAHALVTQERCNDDHRQSPEKPSQTTDLLRVLIPEHDKTLREVLHVLDRDGNTLTHNIAVRGLDELLTYILSLEVPSRRKAMVNSCSRGPKGHDWSVLAAVHAKFDDTVQKIRISAVTGDTSLRHRLIEKSNRLTKVKHILLAEGAEMNPSTRARWQIWWPNQQV